MSTGEIHEDPPIYGRLVQERGDVLAETRTVAERALRQANEALDFNSARPARQRSAEPGTFSAFG
ncbi:hypothetical protein [Streptomyces anulatus]|uniref:hypothetical protein n=1 Tax=Streptomyces anulatus TaxID=1892 RepID=UPI001C26F1E3|nr:hypothetical protein [Streptomyces anulatus]